MKYKNIREEELKNKVGVDFFADFDTTSIVGNIDFCVLPKQQGLFGHTAPLLRAEAKTGDYDVPTMFVQLILTIGKARTFDKMLAPVFLGAFDGMKIAFIEYLAIQDIFYENDFNWNVPPSNHETREFKLVLERVKGILHKNTTIFEYEKDEKRLREFIKLNISQAKSSTKIKINKNNFIPIYLRWLEQVKSEIAINNRDELKKNNIMDSDFFLADLFVDDHNTQTIGDDETVKSDLFVVFDNWGYRIAKESLKQMFDSTIPIKNKKKYEFFWKNYKRPPLKEYQEYIIQRRDLIVPQDIRERKGAYFTPRIWVEKSQEYMADYFGENYQDEYYIWDCAAGTGNLLAGLTNKYNIYASTLDMADVQVMKDMAEHKTANLLKDHIFQFDFLNDDFSQLPQSLQDIINDPEKRKKLILYINPPYAEAGNVKQRTGNWENKAGTSITNKIYEKYKGLIGKASNELFAQFLIRIYKEIPNCKIAEFSTLKILQSANFSKFRKCFLAKLEKIFIVPANTFDNVKWQFPIWFKIWNCEVLEEFKVIISHTYNYDKKEVVRESNEYFILPESYISSWTKKWNPSIHIWMMNTWRTDFQNQNLVHIQNETNDKWHSIYIDNNNITQSCLFFAIRHCISATWKNDRRQFEVPKNWREQDSEFQTDCLIFTLFHGQNRITSAENDGVNHRIPFTEQQVEAREKFKSRFMTDFLKDKVRSPEAEKVYQAWLALWRYYHEACSKDKYLANASLYEIREYFQWRNEKGKMNAKSSDETYTELIGNLRNELKNLANKIADKVYEYEFLKR